MSEEITSKIVNEAQAEDVLVDSEAAEDSTSLSQNVQNELPNPFGEAYASPTPPFHYYVEFLFTGAEAAIIGLFALGYLNVVYEVPKLWLSYDGNDAYPQDPDTVQFAAGKPLWIAIGAASGLAVGLLRAYIFHLDEYNSFIEELETLKTNPREGVKVCILCLLSLMGGASVGPEAGLGAACGVLAYLLTRPANLACKWVKDKTVKCSSPSEEEEAAQNEQQLEDERRSKLLVLTGFGAAFSSILPSPAAAILLCLEVPGWEGLENRHGMEYMRTIGLMSFAGTISFLVYRSIEDNTFLPSGSWLPGFLHSYDINDIVTGLGFGVMGSCLAFGYVIIAAIVKKVAIRMRSALNSRLDTRIATTIMGVVGGTLIGLFGYLFPLTVGDGSYQIGAVIVHGGKFGNGILVASSFVKMLTYWISVEFGFVGGLFFPLLIASAMMGRVFVNITDASWAVGMACSLVAMAAALTPMPLAMMVLALSTFNLDSLGFVPTLLCVIVAHVLFAGIGIPQQLLKLATGRKRKD